MFFSSPSSCYVTTTTKYMITLNAVIFWLLLVFCFSQRRSDSNDLLPCLMSAWGSHTGVLICVVFFALSANILREAKVLWKQITTLGVSTPCKAKRQRMMLGLNSGTIDFIHLCLYFLKRLPRVWLCVLHLCYLLLCRLHRRDGVEGLQTQ